MQLETIAGLMKERATFVKDILTEGAYLFDHPTQYDEQTVSKKWKENAPELMSEWLEILHSLPSFKAPEIEAAFKSFIEQKGLGIGAVLPLFRLLITGAGMGPSMFEIAEFLGKETCLLRMNQGMQTLANTPA